MSAPERPGPALELRQLLPECRQTTVGGVLGSLDLVGLALSERPYTIVNFVATADGRTAFQGRSRPLSDVGDRAVFHALRERVDAVFAGTGTMRTENYGRLVRDPERRERRAAAGLSPDPLAVLITRSGDVPTEIPLFHDPDSRVVVFTSKTFNAEGLDAQVDLITLDLGKLTLTTMMRCLRAEYGVRALLCEGGPTIFSALLHEHLVDELFLTLSPQLAGGGSDPAVTSGPELPELQQLRTAWTLERDGSLFFRYALR